LKLLCRPEGAPLGLSYIGTFIKLIYNPNHKIAKL